MEKQDRALNFAKSHEDCSPHEIAEAASIMILWSSEILDALLKTVQPEEVDDAMSKTPWTDDADTFLSKLEHVKGWS